MKPSEKQKIGPFFIRNRILVVVVVLILTTFFGIMTTRVKMKTPTIDLFPKNHPYVETYAEYQDVFGGADHIAISLEVLQGDVFNTKTLEKLWRITKAIELLPAVNNYSVLSLAQRKIKITTVDEIKGFKSDPVMWPDVPQSEEQLSELRRKVYASGRYHGSLVSTDDKSLMIYAGFFEKGLQSAGDTIEEVVRYIASVEGQGPEGVEEAVMITSKIAADQKWSMDDTLFTAIRKISVSEEDENHKIRMIGRPIMLGWIAQKYPQLAYIFLLTVLVIIISLVLYFRNFVGVVIPMLTATFSAIWGIGFLGLLNYLAEVR